MKKFNHELTEPLDVSQEDYPAYNYYSWGVKVHMMDEDLWQDLDQGVDDDELEAREAAFVRGYSEERRRAREGG